MNTENKSSRRVGRIKWFNTKSGIGFIIPVDGTEDVFIHVSVLKDVGIYSLYEGQVIEYDIGIAPNGKPCAVDIGVPMIGKLDIMERFTEFMKMEEMKS